METKVMWDGFSSQDYLWEQKTWVTPILESDTTLWVLHVFFQLSDSNTENRAYKENEICLGEDGLGDII